VLLQNIFPKVRYEDFHRALCVLDRYDLHLDWQVIETANKMGSIENLLRFPIMDMNRDTLWHRPGQVGPGRPGENDRLRGNESWKTGSGSGTRVVP
jgi:hypothetical protein